MATTTPGAALHLLLQHTACLPPSRLLLTGVSLSLWLACMCLPLYPSLSLSLWAEAQAEAFTEQVGRLPR